VFAVAKPNAIAAHVKKLSKVFNVAIIDDRAHLQEMHVEVIKASDLVLIPVQPSPADIWPPEKIVEMI
jgi:chromosome partitioning protein